MPESVFLSMPSRYRGNLRPVNSIVELVPHATNTQEVITVDDSDSEEIINSRTSLPASNGQSPNSAYPFKLHDDMDIPWDCSIKNGRLTLFSRRCEDEVDGTEGACRACLSLPRNNIWKYYGIGGLQKLLGLKNKRIEWYRLRSLNHARTLATKIRALDDHKRFLAAVASKRVERVDRIVRLGLRHGRGIRFLLGQCVKAAEGLYSPKDYEERDYMRGIVLWKLGGNRIAGIAHRALGLPSITTLKNQTRIPPIGISPRQPTVQEVSKNVAMSFEGMEEALKLEPGARNRHAVLMFDEIATEQRLRWDSKTNMIVGVCREHADQAPLEFNSGKDVEAVYRALDGGKIHYAKEATIGAVGVLSDDNRMYGARGVLISGDCKKETGQEHAKVLQTVLDGVNEQKPTTKTRIVSIASDGESRRGAAMVMMTFKKKLSPDSDIYSQLSSLPFMNFHVGDDDLTPDKDFKHVFKRLRNLCLRESGFVVGGVRITPSIIKAHLQAEKAKADHIRSILNPDDKQDVKLAFDLLKAIWALPAKTESTNPSFIRAREALWTFGQFVYHLMLPYLCPELSLSEQLEHLSAAAHLAMFLYRTDGKDGLPTLLYTDLMVMIKNAYFCVAKAKVDNPNGSFWVILLGTDRLEELFGDLRTMVGNDANLDLLQVSWRLSGTAEVANILSKYPHWDRPPRRLKVPPIGRDFVPLTAVTDHLKPRFWVGNTKVKTVTLQTTWSGGRHIIEKSIRGASEEFAKMEKQKTTSSGSSEFDILSPNGKLLVDTSGADPGPADDSTLEDNDGRNAEESEVPSGALTEDDAEAGIEVEDALSDAEPDEDTSHPPSFERTITLHGKPVAKARALAIYNKHRSFPTSFDRLKRVRHVERFASRLETIEEDTMEDEAHTSSLLIHDPISTMLWSNDRLWLGIGEVTSIKKDGRAVDGVELDLLVEDTVQVSFQLLGLRPSTVEEDPKQKHDWRTYSVPEHSFSIPGRLVEVINPKYKSIPARPSLLFYLLDSVFLVAVSAGLLGRLSLDDLKLAPRIAPLAYFPYREVSGKACFLCEDERELSGLGGASTVECEYCEVPPLLDVSQSQRVIEHMASHILRDANVKEIDEPCGLCLRPYPLCKYYLKKSKGAEGGLTIDRKRSECKYSIKFYYHTAAKVSSTSPCSNVPVPCPLCPKSAPAVWKYNLKAHFVRKHPTQVSKGEYSKLWEITSYERAEVMKRRNVRRPQVTESVSNQLVVSDAHKSSNTSM